MEYIRSTATSEIFMEKVCLVFEGETRTISLSIIEPRAHKSLKNTRKKTIDVEKMDSNFNLRQRLKKVYTHDIVQLYYTTFSETYV